MNEWNNQLDHDEANKQERHHGDKHKAEAGWRPRRSPSGEGVNVQIMTPDGALGGAGAGDILMQLYISLISSKNFTSGVTVMPNFKCINRW